MSGLAATGHTGKHGTIGAVLAEIVSARVTPDELVTFRHRVDAPWLLIRSFHRLQALLARRYPALTIEVMTRETQWWGRIYRVKVRGPWRDVSRYAHAWQKVTGER